MYIKGNVAPLGSPVWLYFKIPEVQTASSPLRPEARSGKDSLAKESLSPASEDLFSLEDTLEHSAMFEFYWHFFQIVAIANWKGLADDFIQYLKS